MRRLCAAIAMSIGLALITANTAFAAISLPYSDNFSDNSTASEWTTHSAFATIQETNQRVEVALKKAPRGHFASAFYQLESVSAANFSLQVDYSLAQWPSGGYFKSAYLAIVGSDGFFFIKRQSRPGNPNRQIYTTYFSGPDPGSPHRDQVVTNTTDATAVMKITRNGGTLTALVNNVPIGSTDRLTSVSFNARFGARGSENAHAAGTLVLFDNFSIN